MNFNKFCNICFSKENIIKLCWEENEQILNVLISFTSYSDIVNGIIYLCINCCNKLEEYCNFRELCLTNFVKFRHLYNEHKKHLEIHNAPDIEIKLKAFVDVNVERPSGTPLIECCEAAQALRNDTKCNIELYDEASKIGFGELVNKNDLSHTHIAFSTENNTLENDTKTCLEKYENDSLNEDQENNASSVVKNESNPDRLKESHDQLVSDTVVKASPCCESAEDDTSYVTKTCLEKYETDCFSEDQENNASSVVKNELNPDGFETSEDQLVSDTVANASPCRQIKNDDTTDVSFNPEYCVTVDRRDEEGSPGNENKRTRSDTVGNVCDENFDLHEKRYKRDKCHKKFTDTAKLKTEKSLHSGKSPYKCDKRELTHKKKSALKIGTLAHTGEKPYKCDECGLSFTKSYNLNIHKRTHTGEKPYKCDECGLCFTQSSHLKIHKRKHTSEKTYKCDKCDYRCKIPSNLKVHKLIHTGEKPYQCDECDYRCTQSSALQKHKRIHTGEKPFKCDECDVRFTQKSSFKEHKFIHTGEKPYKCGQCGHAFTHRSNFRRHKLVHIDPKP